MLRGGTPGRHALACALCVAAIAVAILGTAMQPKAADAGAHGGTAINLALQGEITGAPDAATAAFDGDASTTWCPRAKRSEVAVDLGVAKEIEGFGYSVSGADATVRAATFTATRVAAETPTWVKAPPHTRAERVTFTVSGGEGLCIGELRVLGPSSTAPPILGGDLSFAQQETAAGASYTDEGAADAPERILSDHGFNYARLRLWVDPPAGYSDLESMLATARRADAAGMRVLVDFHYSDFWADPEHQETPTEWAGQSLPELRATVRDYTTQVLDALSAQGTPADIVQVGNETRAGMLWPAGEIDFDDEANGWDAFGSLLRAGVDGAQRAEGPTPRIAIHLDNGADNDLGRYYFDNVVDQDVDFDVIGLSYYPFFHGSPSELRTNLDDLSSRYGKDVMLLETQYPWTLDYADDQTNICCDPEMLTPGYPATPGGQLALESDALSILAAVPEGRGAGLFYWAPDWLPGVGYSPEFGNPNENLTLFDFDGAALPAVELRNPITACSVYAAGDRPCTFPAPAG